MGLPERASERPERASAQVKRMFAAAALTVVKLHRKSFGEHTVEGLKAGEWRLLELPNSAGDAGGSAGDSGSCSGGKAGGSAAN